MKDIEIRAETGSFNAKFASGILTQSLGMRFRTRGRMFFDFPFSKRWRIDMLFVPASLHLYFIDAEKKVVEIQKAETYGVNPRTWKIYRPEKPYRYLLESFEPLEIEEGEELEFEV